MVLKNKLSILSQDKLDREEERLSKLRAVELFDDDILDQLTPGTFSSLAKIHEHLFFDIYDFAGELREEDVSKDGFLFALAPHLHDTLTQIDRMPQSTFDQIVEKYVEMNAAHPFREGNGRSMRIWLDQLLKASLSQVVDWSQISSLDYMAAMQQSAFDDTEIKALIKGALTNQIDDRQMFMKGIDASYAYEGYNILKACE